MMVPCGIASFEYYLRNEASFQNTNAINSERGQRISRGIARLEAEGVTSTHAREFASRWQCQERASPHRLELT